MAHDTPKFSPGLVTAIVALIWVAVFAGFIIVGMEGVAQQAAMLGN
jgi:hypothetical protein|tara:strand:+ start:53119 stop:53256 length:138 start_codon:yes stop_codon:yes gene_type:complete